MNQLHCLRFFYHKHFLKHFIYNWCKIFALVIITSTVSIAQNVNQDSAYDRSLITKFFETQASVKYIYQCTLSPDATAIAWCNDEPDGQAIYYKSLLHVNDKAIQITAGLPGQSCNENEPSWSPDGKKIAFLSDAQSKGQMQLYIINIINNSLETKRSLSHFNGYVSHLQWSPDGQYLSVLYVENASRDPSPMAAENKMVGLIDSNINKNVQRLVVINTSTGETKFITSIQMYIYEYDWSPDSKSFTYTAALPPGDDDWYIAKLYTQNILKPGAQLIYAPQKQIALPKWSPDGKHIAFIEGLMSDQGGTGGEIYMIDILQKTSPRNLTPNRSSTPSWFIWQPDGNILFTEFIKGSVGITTLNTSNGATKTIWHGDESIRAGDEETSLSVVNNQPSTTVAFIRSSWNNLPEVWYGNFAQQQQITHFNDSIIKPILRTKNITWLNEKKNIQGWLLYPQNYDSTKLYPMLVCVHGGPAWIATPTWAAPDFNTTVYTQLGYFVFFPNSRGSFGQGEQFTLANRRDWGFGDLRDIITGVDTLINNYSIDNNRIGILGWSYGGSMAMIAITQTNKFKAAVAGAGACNWQSYYGQNSIDKWMRSYFDASPYDDTEAYKKVSAITYIQHAKTPTLILVGERDGESPPAQSFEFWHALKELNVPTQLYVYPDEGHEFEKFENMIDVSVRTVEWFNKYMPR